MQVSVGLGVITVGVTSQHRGSWGLRAPLKSPWTCDCTAEAGAQTANLLITVKEAHKECLRNAFTTATFALLTMPLGGAML